MSIGIVVSLIPRCFVQDELRQDIQIPAFSSFTAFIRYDSMYCDEFITDSHWCDGWDYIQVNTDTNS